MTPGLLLFALVDAMLFTRAGHAYNLANEMAFYSRAHYTLAMLDLDEAQARLGQWRALWWG